MFPPSFLEVEFTTMSDDQHTSADDEYAQLAEWLKTDKGYSDLEVEKILLKVRHYEEHVQIDSVMDSISNGHLDLTSIISEALDESP